MEFETAIIIWNNYLLCDNWITWNFYTLDRFLDMKRLFTIFLLFLILHFASASCVKQIGDENGPCVGYISPMPLVPYTPLGISLLDWVAGVITLGFLAIYFRTFFQHKQNRTKKPFDIWIFLKHFFHRLFVWVCVVLTALFFWATINTNDGRFVWISLFLSGMSLIASTNGNQWIESKINRKLSLIIRVILLSILLFLAFTAFILSIIGSSPSAVQYLY